MESDKMREVLELKEQIMGKIEKHEEEIEFLKRNLDIINSIVKQSSFTKASDLHTPNLHTPDLHTPEPKDSTPITNGANGDVIANAHVTPNQISIVLSKDTILNMEIPPFKSFFIDRIIKGMIQKDQNLVNEGKIQKESIINWTINKNGENINEIIIKNYRQQERVKEITNTAGWTLTRMLEKIK